MKICIVVPAHNESKEIDRVLDAIKGQGLDVVVIDDGSTDDCGTIARQRGVVVLRNETRQGKGVSLQRGFDYALKKGYDGVITMDGDGQHDPQDLPLFLKKAGQERACVIVGTRMQNTQGMPWVRNMTNRVMSAFISRICKQDVPDTQCGYRYISCEILRQIQIMSNDFEIETEILIKASKKGYRIYSVPIKTIYRNEESKIRPLKDTVRFFAYITREMRSPKT